MIVSIKNSKQIVKINSKGAELWSIQDAEGQEYLWQGDAKYWAGRSPNIFPYVARLTDGKYIMNNKEYAMGNHGFARHLEFEIENQLEDKVVFLLRDSNDTLGQYPYHFSFRITYQLIDAKLEITYSVENKNDVPMYFGVGGHPGFNLPLDDSLEFEDYYLEFKESKDLIQVGMTQDCFVSGDDTKFALKDNRILPLAHDLFDNDAIILKNMPKEVILKSDKSSKKIKIDYPDMDCLGIWHAPGTNAPYICIEPWTSLPSRDGIVEDLAKQEDLICLGEGKTYTNTWSIEIIK